MARLEELTKGARVRGVTAEGVVEVVAAQWFGTEALERTLKPVPSNFANEIHVKSKPLSSAEFERIDRDLWRAADIFRPNSKLTRSPRSTHPVGCRARCGIANRFSAATRQAANHQVSCRRHVRFVLMDGTLCFWAGRLLSKPLFRISRPSGAQIDFDAGKRCHFPPGSRRRMDLFNART